MKMGIWCSVLLLASFAAAQSLAQQERPARTEDEPAADAVPAADATEPSAASVTDPDGPRLAHDEPIPAGELEAFLDGMIQQTMLLNHIAGVTVAVVQNDAIVLKKGYGFADLGTGRRVDPDTTMFRIGSITKTFTWIAVLKEVEAGRLSLDDPINEHLPPEDRVPEQGFAQPILIRHLMTHSPGFEDRALGSLFVRTAADIRPLARFLAEERVDRVREPGKLSSYSNYGAALAGAVLENVDGRPWQDIVEARILGPLALGHTTGREPYTPRDDLPAPLSDALAGDISTGYRWAGVDYAPQSFVFITQVAPAGAMSASAADMARYMRMLLNDGVLDGVRIFSPSTAAALRAPMTHLPLEVGNWAAGFFDYATPGGLHTYGHSGGALQFFSNMMIFPELDLGIFVSTNTTGGNVLSGTVPARVVSHFYLPRPTAPPEGSASLRAVASNYAGTYLATRRSYSRLEGFLMRAATLVTVSVNPQGFLVAAADGPPRRYLPTDTPGLFRSVDNPSAILFEPAEGRAQRIVGVAVSLERVGFLGQPRLLAALAGLTLAISLIVLITLIARRGYKPPNSANQQLSCHARVAASLCWLVAFTALGVLAFRARANQDIVVYSWPTTSILVFSTGALVASLLSAGSLALLPAVWRGSPGPRQWSVWRKLRFTFSLLVFVSLTVVLGYWGALQPWNP